MSGYHAFASCYDAFMDNVDYAEYADLIMSVCKRYDHKPTLALDAACGTGSLTVELARKGLDMIGVDCSEEMLSIAKNKPESEQILYLCQDLTELDLYGTINLALCALDSLNHITDKTKLKKALSRISLFCQQGSLFIFDVNTVYKHKNILGNNTFVMENDKFFLSWQNTLIGNNTVEISLDCFQEKDGVYRRFSDDFCERAYSSEEWDKMLKSVGFSVLEKLDFDTKKKPRPNSEKIIYIARKDS